MARSETRPWLERGLLLLILVVIILVYMYVVNIELREMVRPHDCLFTQATGLLCPACGGTRAIGLLLDGQIIPALQSNLLAVLTLPLIFYALFILFRLAFDRHFTPADIRIAPFWIWSYFAFVLLFWFVRNLPTMTFLRPT